MILGTTSQPVQQLQTQLQQRGIGQNNSPYSGLLNSQLSPGGFNSSQNNPADSLTQLALSQVAPQLQSGAANIAQAGLAQQLDPQLFAQQQQYQQEQALNTLAGQQLTGQENLAAYQNQMANFGLQGQENTAAYQNQMANLGLQGTYQQNTLNNQLAQLGLSQQGLGLEQGYLGQQQQIAGGQYGLTQQGLQAQLGNLAYQLPLAQQQQAGAAAAAGASNSVGARNAQDTLLQQYGFNTGNIGREQQQAALANQLQNAGFSYQQGQLGLQGQGLQLQGQQLQNTGSYEQQLNALGQQYAGTQYGFGQQQLGLEQGYAGQQYGFGQQQLGLQETATGQQYGYQQATSGIQGALQAAQDQSSLMGQIANQASTIQQATSPLAILQGMNLNVPAQGNTGN